MCIHNINMDGERVRDKDREIGSFCIYIYISYQILHHQHFACIYIYIYQAICHILYHIQYYLVSGAYIHTLGYISYTVSYTILATSVWYMLGYTYIIHFIKICLTQCFMHLHFI